MASDNEAGRGGGLSNTSAAPERSNAFSITVTTSAEELTATMWGRLTISSVADCASQILKPIDRLKPLRVSVDGSQLSYCDGSPQSDDTTAIVIKRRSPAIQRISAAA
jgi:hypothetical protein